MALILCRYCRLLLVADAAPAASLPHSPTPTLFFCLLRPTRRGMRPTMLSPPKAPPSEKWFVHRLNKLADAPFAPHLLPSGWRSQALHFLGRAAAAAAIGGYLCVVAVERKRRATSPDGLRPFGYASEEGDGWLEQLRVCAPLLAFCVPALVIGNLIRSRRISPSSLSAACRHLFDRPGRSAALTSPWLSSLWVMHAGEFLFANSVIFLLCLAKSGLAPEEMILAFFTGVLASSAGRCLYQSLQSTRMSCFWYGPQAGIAALFVLSALSIRQEVIRDNQQQRGVGGDPEDENAKVSPRSVASKRSPHILILPEAFKAFLCIWTFAELLLLLLRRRARGQLPPVVGRCDPEMQSVTSLTGMTAGGLLWACLDWRLRLAGNDAMKKSEVEGAIIRATASIK